jgi:histidine triad (HIT) family protein
METNCVFCEIVSRVRPNTLLEVGQHAVVFLDKNQAARGHLLLVPKQHVSLWYELEEHTAIELAKMSLRWSNILLRAFAPEGYNLLINNGKAAGQEVLHCRMHLTPRQTKDGYYRFGGKLHIPDEAEFRQLESILQETAKTCQ